MRKERRKPRFLPPKLPERVALPRVLAMHLIVLNAPMEFVAMVRIVQRRIANTSILISNELFVGRHCFTFCFVFAFTIQHV